jgi:hypothetical protein
MYKKILFYFKDKKKKHTNIDYTSIDNNKLYNSFYDYHLKVIKNQLNNNKDTNSNSNSNLEINDKESLYDYKSIYSDIFEEVNTNIESLYDSKRISNLYTDINFIIDKVFYDYYDNYEEKLIIDIYDMYYNL